MSNTLAASTPTDLPNCRKSKLDLEGLRTGQTLVFDGAMGTMLQQSGFGAGLSSEAFNLNFPEVVTQVHLAYLQAGADVLSLNTFSVSKQLASDIHYDFVPVVEGAAHAAQKAQGLFHASKVTYTAYDMGPTGVLMKPAGTQSFDEAYDIFAKQARLAESVGCDFILIETITDITEARAALLAAKENTQLPVAVTLSFQKDGRTLNGTDPETMAHILSALGADVLGINCSLGPSEILPLAKVLSEVSPVPVMVQANAGMPYIKDGSTCFPSTPEEFAKDMAAILACGVSIVGGCCGTSPEHIQNLKAAVGQSYVWVKRPPHRPVVCSPVKTLYLDHAITVVGERLNPSGNKKLKAALKEGDRDEALKQALQQERLSAQILDLNAAIPGLDERELLLELSSELSALVETPLQFDSSNYRLFEEALRKYPGKALINSANAKQEVMDAVFPVAARYGALVVCLLLDENGLPQSFDERMAMADRMVKTAQHYGLKTADLAIDCLTLTAAAQQDQAVHTLKAIEAVKERYGCLTTLGVSNISYGLPCRPVMNRAFLAAALERGLDLPIIDPYDKDMMDTVRCFRVLKGYDHGAVDYVEWFKPAETENKLAADASALNDTALPTSGQQREAELFEAVLNGYKEDAEKTARLILAENEPLYVINTVIVPALTEIGRRFEVGKAFLPQLIRAAEAAGRVFDVIRDLYPESEGHVRSKVILATVHGDIHDIGKNLVKVLLKNHGFNVIDLGKDVPPDAVLSAVERENCKVVGLSALMTTTLPSMEATIQLLRKHHDDVTIFVGGAVLTEDYARVIGADHYCKDALASVHLCQKIYA